MAKPKFPEEQEGEISFTIVKFSLKGSDTTLQKGVDALKLAFAQAGLSPVPEVRQVRQNGSKQVSAVASEAEPEDAEELVEVEEVDLNASAPGPAPRKLGVKKQPNYKVIPGLAIDDVNPTLKDFLAERQPKAVLQKYLAIAYWFKHFKKIEDLTTEHWFTAYKLLGWTPPANPAGPVGDLRHVRRQHLSKGSAHGSWTINNVGESIVMGLGKASD